MIRYQLFPRSIGINNDLVNLVECFIKNLNEIESENNKNSSNGVLKIIENDLKNIGYNVEGGKSKDLKIEVPVLFGPNNRVDKYFNADAVSINGKIVLEVEAGRAVLNNQFLKDIFQACMMYEVEYLAIAVRNKYRNSDDYEYVYTFLETLYISNRLQLPLKGILLIGY